MSEIASIWSLGSSKVVSGAETLLRPGKAFGVLLYLVWSRTSKSSAHLLDYFWADKDKASGAHSLRQTIWLLRKKLGKPAIIVDAGQVSSSGQFELDLDLFISACDNRDARTALDLYRGDLGADLAFPGGVEFDHWLSIERMRLRERLLSTVDSSVSQLLDLGQTEEAIDLSTRLRDRLRDDQRSWRSLFSSLRAAGDLTRLGAEWAVLVSMVEADGDVLMDQIRRAGELGSSIDEVEQEPTEIVGRSSELATCVRRWQDVVRKRRQECVAIHEVPGMGKSAFLTTLSHHLARVGASSVSARATWTERAISYSTMAILVERLLELPGARGLSPESMRVFAGMNPRLATEGVSAHPARGEEGMRLRCLAVVDLLDAILDESPLALCVDDVQWADAQSTEVLGYAVQRTVNRPLFVVLAGREGVSPIVTPNAVRVRLPPLSESDIFDLMAAEAAVPGDEGFEELVPAIHRVSEGIPFFVQESVQGLIQNGDLQLDFKTGKWGLSQATRANLESAVQSSFTAKLMHLDRASVILLKGIAVSGGQCPLTLLDGLLDSRESSSDDVVDHLRVLEELGYVTISRSYASLVHDLQRERIISETTDEEILDIQRRLSAAGIASHDPGRSSVLSRSLLGGRRQKHCV